MSINYATLTGMLSLDNIDYISTKSLTSQEIFDTGLNKSQILATDATSKLISQPLTNGQLIIGNTTTSSYNAATLTAGSNINVTNGAGSISVATVSEPTFTRVQTASTYTVNNTMTVAAINAIIANLAYSCIMFDPGTYSLTSCLLVQRSNIILDGRNATLTLATNVNQPVICIGDIATNPATIRYYNVTIKNFKIDGNKANQSSEFWASHTWIPASGIAAMMISQLYIMECNLDSCRSGGLTLVNLVDDATLTNCSSTANYFDAYTWYGSRNVKIQSCHAYGHPNGAAISIDNDNQYCVISGCTFVNNKESIFARHSNDVVVNGCVLSGNSQQGIFLAGYSVVGNDRGCERWTFNNNTITNNGSQGLWIQSCKKFTITGNIISNNTGNGFEMGNDTPGNADGTCSYVSLGSNVINNNGGSGCYNNPNNSYTSGARANIWSMNVTQNNTTASYSGDLTSVRIEDDTQLKTDTLTMSNGANTCTLVASAAGSSSVTLPPSNGTAGQFLTTDGTGVTSWATGSTLNIVYTSNTAISFSTTNTTWTNTGFYISIARNNPDAKVRITFNGQIGYAGANYGLFSMSRLMRTITTELSGSDGFALVSLNTDLPAAWTWIDTPPFSGTDTIVYQIVARVFTAGTATLQNSSLTMFMSAEELVI